MRQEEINQHWSEDAGNYSRIIDDELESYRPALWREQIEKVCQKKEMKILDAGCGPGFFSIILSQAGHQVTGVDGAAEMVRQARKKAKSYGVHPAFLEMDCNDLQFPDNTFDLVISRNVTHTLLDHSRVYGEWKRVLKPGGKLLIFDANWHLTEPGAPLYQEYRKRFQKCILQYGDAYGEEDMVLEEEPEVSGSHVLGHLVRPQWDQGILEELGYRKIQYKTDISRELWDDKEKLIYGATPMFMIQATKQ